MKHLMKRFGIYYEMFWKFFNTLAWFILLSTSIGYMYLITRIDLDGGSTKSGAMLIMLMIAIIFNGLAVLHELHGTRISFSLEDLFPEIAKVKELEKAFFSTRLRYYSLLSEVNDNEKLQEKKGFDKYRHAHIEELKAAMAVLQPLIIPANAVHEIVCTKDIHSINAWRDLEMLRQHACLVIAACEDTEIKKRLSVLIEMSREEVGLEDAEAGNATAFLKPFRRLSTELDMLSDPVAYNTRCQQLGLKPLKPMARKKCIRAFKPDVNDLLASVL